MNRQLRDVCVHRVHLDDPEVVVQSDLVALVNATCAYLHAVTLFVGYVALHLRILRAARRLECFDL